MSLTSYQAAPPRVLKFEVCRIERRAQPQNLAGILQIPVCLDHAFATDLSRLSRRAESPSGSSINASFGTRSQRAAPPILSNILTSRYEDSITRAWIFASRATAAVGT